MIDSQQNPGESKRRSIDSRRITLLLAAWCAAWTLIVAIVSRVGLGYVDVLEVRPTQVDQLFLISVVHGGIAVAAIVMMLFLRRRQKPLGNAWPRFVLLACVLVGGLSCDLIVGFYFPPSGRDAPLYVHHPRRGYAHQKNAVIKIGESEIRFNRFGFRGPQVPRTKPPGEYRILFVGDSITFGYMLKSNESPVALVRKMIAERGTPRPVRCINAGVPGYTTWQELDLLQHEGAAVEPDLVVLVFYVNDVIEMAGVERGVVSGRTWDIGLPASTHWSGLVRMISRQLAEREQASIQQHQHHWANARVFAPGHPAGLTGEEDVYREPPLPSMTDAWRRTLLELDGVVETCKSLNAELIIVHATDTLELSKQPDHRLPSRAIRQWAQSRGLPFVNLADDYLAATGGDAERIEKMFLDGTHPSPEGARVMAKRLTDAVFEHALDGLE